jgi:hypothetical protein
LADATALKLDIQSVGSRTKGKYEPIYLKIQDNAGGVIYEKQIPKQTADQWNTFTLNLQGIAAPKRSAITHIVLYLYNKDTAIKGRATLQYLFDNLRVLKPWCPANNGKSGFIYSNKRYQKLIVSLSFLISGIKPGC